MDVLRTTRVVVTGLAKSYPGLTVLKELDLSVSAGEVVAIRGASGTGKSTLLHCLGLLDRPDSGSISLDGDELTTLKDSARSAARARRVGFVFQAFHLLPEFDVLENVLMTARTAGLPLGTAEIRARDLLGRLGLADRARQDVRTLSGGERQRVALCRALLPQPQLLLADEPTGNLDPATAAVVLDQLLELARQAQASVVIVTHDPAIAARADRRLSLHEGRLHAES
ncbi:MAG TPA: ABC transporter ATP-binding protein [Planctomycetota bacterium]|jgi:ABC-type lipoprotein export system ATPase subunit|nr:ABC transporter ATP-binding protein [Planctomycetota bacterium]